MAKLHAKSVRFIFYRTEASGRVRQVKQIDWRALHVSTHSPG